MKKRIMCVMIAVVMLLAMLVSCASENNNSTPDFQSDTQSQDSSDESGGEASEEISDGKLTVPHLNNADIDLTGFELTILTATPQRRYSVQQHTGVFADTEEEDKTDPICAAVKDRNELLKGLYGFDVRVIVDDGGDSGIVTRIRNDNMNNLNDYELISFGASLIAPVVTEGLCYDYYDLDDSYLQLDQPWWDPVTQKDMSIADSIYMINGDLLVADEQYTKCMFFNKDIVKTQGLKNPFDLVYDNKWTLDEMYAMMKQVAVPGGDGKMDFENYDDTWGMVCVAFDTYMMVMGGGLPQIVKNSDDIPEFAVNKPENVDVYMKVYDIMSDTSATGMLERSYRWDDYANNFNVMNQFYTGHSLFMCGEISYISNENLRGADIHYGIIPYPKYSAEQDNYASTVNPYHFGVLAIPISNTEIAKTTFCMEALAYIGRELVRPVYFEQVLKNKLLNDDEDSPRMLDVIFDNRLVDMSVVFNWDDCIQYYNRMIMANNVEVTSFCEKEQPEFQKALDETITLFKMLKGK